MALFDRDPTISLAQTTRATVTRPGDRGVAAAPPKAGGGGGVVVAVVLALVVGVVVLR